MPITKATASSIAPAAKGDLVVGSATNDAAVLAVGTNNHVLTADSSTTTGLKWAAASSGALTLVTSHTIGSGVSSITLSNVFSSTYDNYLIVLSGGTHSTDNPNYRMQMGSTTTGYYLNGMRMFGNSTGITGLSENNTARWGFVAQSTSNGLNGIIELIGPNLAKWTGITARQSRYVTSDPNEIGNQIYALGFLADTTQYTGFTFDWLYGTATGGTIKIYGYAN